MRKRRGNDAGFRSRVALEAVNGECMVSEKVDECGVDLTMIPNWRKAVPDGMAEILDRGGAKAPKSMRTR